MLPPVGFTRKYITGTSILRNVISQRGILNKKRRETHRPFEKYYEIPGAFSGKKHIDSFGGSLDNLETIHAALCKLHSNPGLLGFGAINKDSVRCEEKQAL